MVMRLEAWPERVGTPDGSVGGAGGAVFNDADIAVGVGAVVVVFSRFVILGDICGQSTRT